MHSGPGFVISQDLYVLLPGSKCWHDELWSHEYIHAADRSEQYEVMCW